MPGLLLSISILAALGCGGYMGGAKRAYGQGRYFEAAEKLGEHEHEVETLSPRRQAEYGIYRGLSLMMLNDYASARRWLAFADDVERRNPGTLQPEQRVELDSSYRHVTQVLSVAAPGALVAPSPAPLPDDRGVRPVLSPSRVRMVGDEAMRP